MMPLTVAQLNIMVSANTTAAQQALAQINAQFAQMAQNAASAAVTEVQGQEQVIAALHDVQTAISSVTMAIRNNAAQQVTAASGVQQSTQQVSASIAGMGSVGSGALMSINQAMIASGQSLGPLNSGIMMIATNLRLIPPAASAAQNAIMGVGVALSALGIISAAVGAPAQQGFQQLQNEFNNAGASLEQYQGKIDAAVEHGAKLGRTQDEIYNALTRLVRGLNDPDEALRRLGLAEDIAAAKGESLSAAAFDVVRAYEGYGRGLKQFGIDIQFTHNAEAGLEAANRSLRNATDQVAAAQQRLTDAVTRQNDRMAQAALATDQVAQAQQRLNDATTSYNELLARQAAQDMVPKISETTRAYIALGDAQQRLDDILRKQAVEDEAPKLSRRAQAIDRVRDAQQRLVDVQARIRDATTLTIVDQDNAAQAADRVAEAQERLALASGGGIIQAQNALRAAISQQREELDRLHLKLQESVTQKQELAKAERDLKEAQSKVATATQADKAEADQKALERAIALRDAHRQITDAVNDLALARRKDAAEAIMAQITRTEQLRAATNAVRDAVQGVAQARRNEMSQAIGAGAGNLSVAAAQRSLEHAKKVYAEAIQRQHEAQEKLRAEQTQGERALNQWSDKVAGAADAASKGWSGSLNDMKAHLINFLADFGNIGGRFLTFALPFLFVGTQLAKVLGIGGAAGGTVGEAGVAAALEETGAAAGVALAPVLGIAAAIAAAGVVMYEAYQHIGPFRDIIDDTGRVIGGFFSGALQKVNQFMKRHEDEWKSLKKEINTAWNVVIHPVLEALVAIFKGPVTAAFVAFGAVVKFVVDVVVGILKTAFDVIIGILDVFLDVITGHWGDAWHDLVNMVSNVFSDIWEMLRNTFRDIGIFMLNAGKVALGLLWSGLQAAWPHVRDFFLNIPAKIWDALKSLWSAGGTMVEIGINIVNALIDGFWAVEEDIWNFFTRDLPDWIWNALKSLWDVAGGMVTAGKNIVIGLWNGIVSMKDWLWDKLTGFADDAWHTITHPWEILSPSRKMHWVGEMIVRGFAAGITDNQHHALNAIQSMNEELQREMFTGTGKLNVGTGGFGGVGSGARGGPTLVNMHVNVHGNVWQTEDLADAMRDTFNKKNNASGGRYFVANGERPR